MLIWTIVKVALKSLLANKLRSFLAMLGIIIGVAAVISTLALGAGARQQIMGRITAMGTRLLVVRPGSPQRGGVRGGAYQSLKIADARAILDEVEGVAAVAPLVSGRAQVKYFNRNTSTSITGAAVTYLGIRSFEIDKGRAFTALEEEQGERVAVLGSATAETLFGTANPVGETFRIKNLNFRAIGVLKSKGDQGWANPDEQVILPYSTAMKQLLGQEHLNEIDIMVADDADMNAAAEAVAALLRKRHRVRPGAEDDFWVRNQAELIETASEFTRTFTILLGSIGGISLLVGGIGIMNIMLVTVTERTREIGVRKAIGARNRDILRQFLLESILMSGLGGVMGIGLGFGGAGLIGWFTQMPTLVEPLSIVMALTVAASVGIFFGLYPAMRAARLDPIESLRYE
jgi:putative ABC transport system permease protein